MCVGCKSYYAIDEVGAFRAVDAPNTPSSKPAPSPSFPSPARTSSVAATPATNHQQSQISRPSVTPAQQSTRLTLEGNSCHGLFFSLQSDLPSEGGQYEYAQTQSKSDQVSKEMGQKLLQGWAMLNETCPDPQCMV